MRRFAPIWEVRIPLLLFNSPILTWVMVSSYSGRWLFLLAVILLNGLFLYSFGRLRAYLEAERTGKQTNTTSPGRKAEPWLTSLSFWIPRKYREPITGDILEDCHEMRELGFDERRIRVHVLWQFAVAIIALWPEPIASAVAAIVRRIWSVKK